MLTKIGIESIEPTALSTLLTPKIASVAITDSSYNDLDDTAVSTDGGYIKLTGTGFTTGCQIIIGTTPATSVSFVSSTEVHAQVPAATAGTYIVYLINGDGGTTILVNGLTYSATPSWVTGSTLGPSPIDTEISIQLEASLATTYSVTAGSTLPPGLSLSSTGLLSGTVTGITEETTYNFSITAIDDELQDSPRSFSINITVAPPPGQQAFITPGTTSFVVPDGVTSICAVLIGAGATGGGGGGAGGSLRWINDLPVTPGETLTVFVGAGGGYGSTGPTTIKRGTDTLILASSNNTAGSWTVPEAANPSTAVGAGPFGGTVGGGNGGAGGGAPAQAGGGGAGGYSGNGGAGGANGSGGSAGSGGGGAGGNSNSANDNFVGGAGGGTGIYGEGLSGTTSRAGGSGGGAGTDGGYRSPAKGGAYGGGGGGTNGYYNGYSPGGDGAARIIWGDDRAFPSTNTQDI